MSPRALGNQRKTWMTVLILFASSRWRPAFLRKRRSNSRRWLWLLAIVTADRDMRIFRSRISLRKAPLSCKALCTSLQVGWNPHACSLSCRSEETWEWESICPKPLPSRNVRTVRTPRNSNLKPTVLSSIRNKPKMFPQNQPLFL